MSKHSNLRSREFKLYLNHSQEDTPEGTGKIQMPHKDPEKRRSYQRQYRLRNATKAAVYIAEWRRDNADKFKAVKKAWLKKHQEQIRNYQKAYRLEHSDELREYHKEYRRTNSGKRAVQMQQWQKRNAAKRRAYRKNQYKQNLTFRLGVNLRSRLNAAVSARCRAGSAVRDLGCSINEFVVYISGLFAPGMSWENRGEWHLDHIKPLAAFDLTDREQFLAACHFTNIQPLWAADNFRKGSAIDPPGTSQECPACGAIVPKLLSERIHTCSCGCVMSRDQASGMVIKNRAFRRGHRGGPIRPTADELAGPVKRAGALFV